MCIRDSPSPFHIPVAQVLAEAGCHLLVEKPFSDRMDGSDALIDTCASRGVTLMVGYNLRFCPSLQAMVRMVADGAAGRIPVSYTHLDVYKRQLHTCKSESVKSVSIAWTA